MLKRVSMFLLILFMMFTLVACSSEESDSTAEGKNGASPEGVITLRFADYMPNTHFASVNAQQVWMKKVEELTEGRIQFEYFPGEQLGKATDMLDLVTTGAADIGNVPQAYIAGKTPNTSVVSLPGLVDNIFQSSKAAFELIQSKPVLESDFLNNGVRPIFAYTSGLYEFWTKDPVKKVKDLKGMKIRSQGGASNLQIEALDAVPVSLAIPEMYEAIDRGTIDGSQSTITSVPSYKLNEVVNYATVGSAGAPTLVFYIINEDKWKSIPENLREKINEATEIVLEEFIAMSVNYDNGIQEELSANGEVEFIEVDRMDFLSAAEKVQADWVAGNPKLPAQEVLNQFKALLEKYK